MHTDTTLDIIIQEFLRICEIPHPSHHEEQIGAYLLKWAKDHGLYVKQDQIGDIIIDKPAYPGYENSPRVILQAHMDMVCVAEEGFRYDPLSDPIRVVNDGKTLRAVGTSLGADDGIGVALCLYILQDKSIKHGPLRVIFTVNEEDGMSSIDMPACYLDGHYLINLDWEWLGSLCNSSAGCDFLTFTRKAEWICLEGEYASIQLTLKGLLGGHSGVDIHRGRANALVCLATALYRLKDAGISFHVADFHGGQAKNAIPAMGELVVTVSKNDLEAALRCLSIYERDFYAAFGDVETKGSFSVMAFEAQHKVLTKETTNALLALLCTLPNNVNTMSPFIPSLVESSQNLGLLTIEENLITLSAMARSCVSYRNEELLRASRIIAEICGFTFIPGDHAPAWAVNPKSKLTPIACEEYKKLTNNEMVVEPVHGGLECGAFFEKNPSLDMIAIGPSLSDVHSPKESCDIESVKVTADLIIAILARLTEEC